MKTNRLPRITHRASRITRSAFTLVEIMVVMVVIAVLAAFIIPELAGTTQDAKVKAAAGNVAELEAALDRFFVHMDRHPTTEEGLKALLEAPAGEENKWRGPYIKILRNDPWDHSYQYRCPGVHHPNGFDVWSRGADGAEGGEGANADVGNWQ
jgi:general secretion pathway protein G